MAHRILKIHEWFHPDGFPLAVERREPQAPFAFHAHEFSELVIITGGSGWHITTSESWPLAAGDVFVISGSRPHGYDRMNRLCLVNILFQPDKLNLPWHDLPALPGFQALFAPEPAWPRRHFSSRLHLSPQELRTALGLVELLEDELKTRAQGFGCLATAAFMRLVGYLSRCYQRPWQPDGRALIRIAPAISHLETHYAKSIDLAGLAALARMSKRSLLRAFQAATGLSPIAYLIQLRINRAARLLLTTTDRITDIAFRVGFNDSNYFSRAFCKLMGMSPRLYRQQRIR